MKPCCHKKKKKKIRNNNNNWRKSNELRLIHGVQCPKAMVGLCKEYHIYNLPSCLLLPNCHFWCMYRFKRLLQCYALLVQVGYYLDWLNCKEDAADDILSFLWLCFKSGSLLALILGSNCVHLRALQQRDIGWIVQLPWWSTSKRNDVPIIH